MIKGAIPLIDFDNLYKTVTQGLQDHCGCVVRRGNQDGDTPKYPYINYNVLTLMSENNGTYGEYADGKDRKPFQHTQSFTVLSDNHIECLELATKARAWFDRVGRLYLQDNNVSVQRIGSVTNRDNLLVTGYEYRYGFDVVFGVFDVVDNPIEQSGVIETVDINGGPVEKLPSYEEVTEQLEKANNEVSVAYGALNRLNKRMDGGE